MSRRGEGAEIRPSLLFVYGTLRRDRGGPAHGYLAEAAEYLGVGRVRGRLYDLGPYPGALPPGAGTEVREPVAGRHPGGEIHGELYRLRDPDALLAALDRHEGCGPDDPTPTEFFRAVAPVRMEDGSDVRAWIYWYGRPVEPSSRIASGDWSGPGSPW